MKAKYILPVLLCFSLLSCTTPIIFFTAGTAAGVAGYKYHRSSLEVIYQAPYMETWDATLKAVENMDLRIESKKHDLTSGKIVAKMADNKSVHLSLKYKSSQETEVLIRVGFFGDEGASMAIKEEIRKVLFGG